MVFETVRFAALFAALTPLAGCRSAQAGYPATCAPPACQGGSCPVPTWQPNFTGPPTTRSPAAPAAPRREDLSASTIQTYNRNFLLLEDRLGKVQREIASLRERCEAQGGGAEDRRHVTELSVAVGALTQHLGQAQADLDALKARFAEQAEQPLRVTKQQLAELRAAVLADLRASGTLGALRGPPGPAGKDGKDGIDGTDADPGAARDLLRRIEALEDGVRRGPIYFDIVPKGAK